MHGYMKGLAQNESLMKVSVPKTHVSVLSSEFWQRDMIRMVLHLIGSSILNIVGEASPYTKKNHSQVF